MFITSRESAIFPEPVSLPRHPNHLRASVSCPRINLAPMLVRGLVVSRAYISPEKPQVKANLRVLLGFWSVFCNRPDGWFGRETICCGACTAAPNQKGFAEALDLPTPEPLPE